MSCVIVTHHKLFESETETFSSVEENQLDIKCSRQCESSQSKFMETLSLVALVAPLVEASIQNRPPIEG